MRIRRSAMKLLVGLAALAGVLLSASSGMADPKSGNNRRSLVINPKFDASAERVELFSGMDDGRLETKIVANDSKGGFVFITNNSDQTLTVDLPKSFVAVQVLKQLGGGMGGGGFFSIPAERTLKVPFVSACLNHGKAEPNSTAQYRMVKVSDYTSDPVLAELITMVGTGRVDQQSAQAAIWTRTDNMSWEQLSTKTVRGIHGFRRYFQPGQIVQGQQLVATAETRVREQGEKAPQAEEPAGGRVR